MIIRVAFTLRERNALSEALRLLTSEAESLSGYPAERSTLARLHRHIETLRALLHATQEIRS